MVSIIEKNSVTTDKSGTYFTGELRGLSTDTKPNIIDELRVGNGSSFLEMDTGKIFFYDLENNIWKEL